MSESASGEAPNGNGQRIKNPLLSDPDWLWEQKWVEGRSSKDIADELGVCKGTVIDRLSRFDIDGRTHPWLDDETWLYVQHVNRDKTVREIADMVGTTKSTVHSYFNEHGVEKPVDRGSGMYLKYAPVWLREKYHSEMLTSEEIAELANCSSSRVRHWMEYHGIDRRAHSELTGELAARWSGGKVYYYGPNWNEQREKAIQRDNESCRDCGVGRDELDEDLHVHHREKIRWFKERDTDEPWYELANRLPNLITLCRSCHKVWERMPVQPEP